MKKMLRNEKNRESFFPFIKLHHPMISIKKFWHKKCGKLVVKWMGMMRMVRSRKNKNVKKNETNEDFFHTNTTTKEKRNCFLIDCLFVSADKIFIAKLYKENLLQNSKKKYSFSFCRFLTTLSSLSYIIFIFTTSCYFLILNC